MSPVEHLAEGVTLYLGDCRDILPTLGKVDAVVTDPPYGIGEAAGKNNSRGCLAAARDYGRLAWDNEPIDARQIEAMREQSRWQIIFGGNYYTLPPSTCWLVWDKLNGDTDFADCELAWTNLPKAVRRICWRWNGMIRKGTEERVHPTQKPVGVMEWCLDQLPDVVRTICDPYMGSGSTGVACVRRELAFVGIEREPSYFDIARRRVSDALKQPSMFIERPASAAQERLL